MVELPVDKRIWQYLGEKRLKVVRSQFHGVRNLPYLPIALTIFMLGEKTPFPLYLKVREEDGGEVKFFPFLEAGETLEEGWLQTLEKLGIDRLYVHRQSLDRVVAYLNNHLLLHSQTEALKTKKLVLLREHLHFSLLRAFGAPRLGKHIKAAQKILHQLLMFLEKDLTPWQFINDLLYHDYSLYQHSVNVSLLGLGFLAFLKKSRQECLVMGLAGLFHDIGLARLDTNIIYKAEPLSQKDWEIMRQHPIAGYESLRGYTALPAEAKQLILEHHENADGSGYPLGLPLRRQHPHTRIIRLLDAYEAMTCDRPYRPARKPFSALKSMQEQQGSRGHVFDLKTLKSLIRFLALI